MKRIWLAALAVTLSGVALAQPMLSSQPLAPTDIKIPDRKQAAPVPALLQTRAHEIYSTTCSGCHGITAQPGAKGPSLLSEDFLNGHTDAQIVQAAAGIDSAPIVPAAVFIEEEQPIVVAGLRGPDGGDGSLAVFLGIEADIVQLSDERILPGNLRRQHRHQKKTGIQKDPICPLEEPTVESFGDFTGPH